MKWPLELFLTKDDFPNGGLPAELEEIRIISRDGAVSGVEPDGIFQVTGRAFEITLEPAAEAQGVLDVIGLRGLLESASENLLGIGRTALADEVDRVVVQVLGCAQIRLALGDPLLAHADVLLCRVDHIAVLPIRALLKVLQGGCEIALMEQPHGFIELFRLSPPAGSGPILVQNRCTRPRAG